MNANMTKLVLMPVLLAAGGIFAGVYGAVHDQLSYSISPEYFQRFKFVLFEFPPELQTRLGAALVGVIGSWWMGILIGFPIILLARGLPTPRDFIRHTLIAYVIVTGVTIVIGLGGLAFAFAKITSPDRIPREFYYPLDLVDAVSYARVGMLHGFSYLGGIIGGVAAIGYLIWIRRRRIVHPPRV